MAEVCIRIKLSDGTEPETLDLSTTNIADVNNVGIKPNSDGSITTYPKANFNGYNGLSFANTYLTIGTDKMVQSGEIKPCTLSSEQSPLEFMWGATDEYGKYDLILELSNALNLSHIVVVGDSVSKQFPIKVLVDNETTLTNDKNSWIISIDKTKGTHTLKFTDWNRSMYNACLTNVRVMKKNLDIKNTAIDNLDSTSQSKSSSGDIVYGVIANTGKFSVTDRNEEILTLIKNGVIKETDTNIDILLNNKNIQTHISNNNDYDTSNNSFSVSLTNKVDKMNQIYNGFNYNGVETQLYKILYDVLYSYYGGDFDIVAFENLLQDKRCKPYNDRDTSISEFLKNIIIKIPIIEYGYTYKQIFDDICTIAQLNMYLNDENEITFIQARPIYFNKDISVGNIVLSRDSNININSFALKNNPKVDVFLENKYDGVKCTISEPVITNTYNSIVDTYNINIPDLTNVTPLTRESTNVEEIVLGSIANTYKELSVYQQIKYYDINYNYVINKKSNYGLTEISKINLFWDEDQETYSINYKVKEYPITATGTWTKDNKITINGNINIGELSNITYTSQSGVANDYYSHDFTIQDGTITYNKTVTTSSKGDKPLVVCEENDDSYSVTITLLEIARDVYNFYGVATTTSTKESDNNVQLTGVLKKYIPLSATISQKGNLSKIEFNSIDGGYITNDTQNIFTLNKLNTHLLQIGTTYNGTRLDEIISKNIISDYEDGIPSISVDIYCTNLTDENNIFQPKELKNGDIVQVGDVFHLNKIRDKNGNPMLFRCNSRTFIYDGSPHLKINGYRIK